MSKVSVKKANAKKALTWVLWSRQRAMVVTCTSMVLIVAFIAVSCTAGGSDTPAKARTAAAASTAPTAPATPTVQATKPGGGEQDLTPTAPAKDTEAAVVSVRAFTTVWLSGRTAKNRTAWLTALAKDANPALMAFMAATPADAIPKASITSVNVTDLADGQATTTVTLSDHTQLTVKAMVGAGGRWSVYDFAPAK